MKVAASIILAIVLVEALAQYQPPQVPSSRMLESDEDLESEEDLEPSFDSSCEVFNSMLSAKIEEYGFEADCIISSVRNLTTCFKKATSLEKGLCVLKGVAGFACCFSN